MSKNNGDLKKKPGAPRGNLNAARSVLPAIRRIAMGKALPAKYNRIVEVAEQETVELVSDKGGVENMSGGEKLMLANWKAARQAEMLIWYEMLQRGAVVERDGVWDLQPGMAKLGTFLTAQRQALQALGLERRQMPVQTVQDYLRQKAEEKENES